MKLKFQLTVLFVTAIVSVILFYGCSKTDKSPRTNDEGNATATVARALTPTPQSLPGGKQYFSAVYGRFNTVGTDKVWTRQANYTFFTDGKVSTQFYQWDNERKLGKETMNAHTCTMRGISKTNYNYCPVGWIVTSGYDINWTGIYTYNTATGLLSITWNNTNSSGSNYWETWYVSAVEPGLAKINFNSSNVSTTHGRGYGSLRSWSTYKTISQIPRDKFYFSYINESRSGTSPTSTSVGWTTSLGLTDFAQWSLSTNGVTLHRDDPYPEPYVPAACSNPNRKGVIYHLGGYNNSRKMAYTTYFACLPTDSEFPSYSRGLHNLAAIQIINDNGDMRGMLGIEQSNSSDGGYGYQMIDWKRP